MKTETGAKISWRVRLRAWSISTRRIIWPAIARIIAEIEDISGATFSTSNLGPYDVEHFSAIINPPEAGILAISTAQKTPVVKPDGSLGVGNRMRVTISVDHRVSDGAEGAQYLQAFRTLIENPMRLLI